MVNRKLFIALGLISSVSSSALALESMLCTGSIGDAFSGTAVRFENKPAGSVPIEAEYRGVSISTKRSGYGDETRVVVKIQKAGPNGFTKISETAPKSVLVINDQISMGANEPSLALHVKCSSEAR